MSRSLEAQLESIVARIDPACREMSRRDVEALRRAGATESYERLLQLAQDAQASPELRATACWVLGRLRRKRALPTLLDLLAHADDTPGVRAASAQALMTLDDERAVPGLVQALESDPDARVRDAAARALGLVSEATFEVTSALLHVLLDGDEEPAVRGTAAEALANLWSWGIDQRVIDGLIGASQDASPEVRFWSAYALGRLAHPRGLSALERLATDGSIVPGWGSVSDEATEAIKDVRERMGLDRPEQADLDD